MAHYYTAEGKLVAEVPYADKAKAGLFRPTDLRDAKKLNLRPSVTTIQGKINKPMVNDYRIKVALDIALNEMEWVALGKLRVSEETVKMIADRSMERAIVAADFGTVIHALVSDAYNGKTPTIQYTESQLQIAIGVVEWMAANGYEVEESERTFVSDEWYAGTIDILGTYHGEPCIADFKTQDALDIGSFNFYEDWPVQLAGYDLGLNDGVERRRISIAVSRLIPGLITHKEWTHDKRMNNKQSNRAWKALLEYWKATSGFGDVEEEEILQGGLLI